MADFSYLTDLSRDQDWVRFHTGDTDESGFWLADSTINALIASTGSMAGAVIAALRYIIGQLSKPNFKADWLQVDNATARAGYETLLAEKKRELGVGAGRPVSGSTNTYRQDSRQTSEPDYSDYGAGRGEIARPRW